MTDLEKIAMLLDVYVKHPKSVRLQDIKFACCGNPADLDHFYEFVMAKHPEMIG
jgi:hypothetical protein